MTTILKIQALPTSPFEGSGLAPIVITNNIPSYFKITGVDLDQIKSFNWYPEQAASVSFETRQLILLSKTEGTFMVKVLNNYLDTDDRGGRLSFQLENGTTLCVPVITYGPVSVGPLQQSPNSGLITG
jgi:hypothetical protein